MMRILLIAAWITFVIGGALNVTPYYHVGHIVCAVGVLLILMHAIASLFQKDKTAFQKLCYMAYFFLALGFLFRLMHYPGASFILLFGCFFLLIINIVYLFKNLKKDLSGALYYLVISFWLLYVYFRSMYWPFSIPLLYFSLILSIVFLAVYFQNELLPAIKKAVVVICVVVGFSLSYVHSYSIFYFYEYPALHSEDPAPYIWHKYSWFLYISGKQEGALKANETAMKAFLELCEISGITLDPIIEQPKTIQETWPRGGGRAAHWNATRRILEFSRYKIEQHDWQYDEFEDLYFY